MRRGRLTAGSEAAAWIFLLASLASFAPGGAVARGTGAEGERQAPRPAFDPARPGSFAVGVRTLVLVDRGREDAYAGGPRTLVTEVWYPAADAARGGEPTRFVDFFSGKAEVAARFVEHFGGKLDEVNRRFRSVAVRGAPLRSGRFPLLIFSHGNGGLRHQNVFQLDHLASHGYIILSPDHTGNAGITVLPDKVLPYDRRGRQRSADDRPKDVSFLIDHALAENRREGGWLHGAVEEGAIGVLGHSFGGYTCCRAAELDARIKAILPMTVAYSNPASVPLLLMLAAEDRTVDQAGNILSTSYYVRSGAPKFLLTLKRGGHFTFSDMDTINPAFGDGIGTSTRDGRTFTFLPNGEAKDIINAYGLAFFDCYLRGSGEAAAFLHTNVRPEEIDLRWEDSRRRRL